ncbi:MAG: hypothetical protein CO108_16915 [Deltaproteobacteria bacterium CG_4_9_14_3_um_filter_63_12]|nr:MAG: hypothetical protein CO108_16915 [Deltaproteobacteria bacterium CG_4_9_14_3_um_filter_63_12]
MTVYTSEEQTTATPDLILDARGLEKSYSGKKVVDGLDLQVRKGSVLGLLGPNGAGKTTALRMLYGFITPDAGRIHYEGQDFAAHRGDIKRWLGVCSQDDTLDSDFTVRANLTTFARYFRPKVTNLTERIGQLLRDFGLVPFVNFSPMQLSGGFKKRLLIARSIVHRPKVLFLDEPTTGLDPKARLDVWNLIDDLRRQGLAIILTTHYMDEAERLSDELVVIDEGRAIANGSPREILGTLFGEHVVVVQTDAVSRAALDEWLRANTSRTPMRILNEWRIPMDAKGLALFTSSFPDLNFQIRPPNLDDLFLDLSKDDGLASQD